MASPRECGLAGRNTTVDRGRLQTQFTRLWASQQCADSFGLSLGKTLLISFFPKNSATQIQALLDAWMES